jgi:hypothetical protein
VVFYNIDNFSPDALKPRAKEEEEQQIAGRTAMA